MRLEEAVTYRGDSLFNGAVRIDWFETDPRQRALATSNFIFHGPNYHGVAQADVGTVGGHRLVDTATLAGDVFQHFQGDGGGEPFLMAIAGWGTGKSHFGLALSELSAHPTSEASRKALDNLKAAAPELGASIAQHFQADPRPLLTIALNGMQDFSLADEVNRQILHQLRDAGHSTDPVEQLRPRFQTAARFVDRNFELRKDDFRKAWHKMPSKEQVLDAIHSQDEQAFARVEAIYQEANGSPIPVGGQESLQQLLQLVCSEYCGIGKAYRGLLVVFDEFGRYLEFAVQRPHVAGPASLQQLFEGIQSHAEQALLLCFIQYELKAYSSRVSPELRTELNRYIGRFDSAKKYYLSTNLETLIAHVLQPTDPEALAKQCRLHAKRTQYQSLHQELLARCPGLDRHALWADPERFARVVVEGCWPLHPAATWTLYYLAADGRSLQQRSALSFLGDALDSFSTQEVDRGFDWRLPPAGLCSDTMVAEFVSSEELGGAGAVAQAFQAVLGRYRHDLSANQEKLLRSVLLSRKLGLRSRDRDDCIASLSMVSGLDTSEVTDGVDTLTSDLGALECDEKTFRFEILGDAVPRTQFTAFLRRKVQAIPSDRRAALFALSGVAHCDLGDRPTDFAVEHRIGTSEWSFASQCTTVSTLSDILRRACEELQVCWAPNEPRGRLIYCYLGSDSQPDTVRKQADSQLKNSVAGTAWQDYGVPILVILLHDEDGALGEALAELHVLRQEISAEERARYGHFLQDAEAQALADCREHAQNLIRKRVQVYCVPKELSGARLSQSLGELFETVYPEPLSFPFDGFNTIRGNAAIDCRGILAELLKGSFGEEWVSSQVPRIRNRVVALLEQDWQCLSEQYGVLHVPGNASVSALVQQLNSQLVEQKHLNLGDALMQLCNPPCGGNLASAGLLLGVFLAPRRSRIVVRLGDKEVSIGNWLSEALTGNFLSIDILRQTVLFPVTANDEQAWHELLVEWEEAGTHASRLAIYSRSVELRKRTAIPEFLTDKFERLFERTQHSLKELKALDNLLAEQDHFIEKASHEGNVESLSLAAAKLLSHKSAMDAQASAWSTSEFGQIQGHLDAVRMGVSGHFNKWLSTVDIIRAAQIGDFRKKYGAKIPETLEKIGLMELAAQLRKHVMSVIAKVEHIEGLKFRVDQADALMRAHRLDNSTPFGEVHRCRQEAEQILAGLKEVLAVSNAPEVKRAATSVRDFIEKYTRRETELKQRGSQLWNLVLSSGEAVSGALTEVTELIRLFAGTDSSDLSDFRSIAGQLHKYCEDWQGLSRSTHLDGAGLSKLADEMLAAFRAKWDEDEDPVPWPPNEVYKALLGEVSACRVAAAGEWATQFVPEPARIASMTAREANAALRDLRQPPAFLEKGQQRKVTQAESSLRKRLSELEVDGLLEQFRSLEPAAQQTFLAKAKKIAGKAP